MGYFSGLQIDIMTMAHDMGDDYGEDAETIKVISRVLQVTPEEVQYVLSAEYDADYAERSADLDAEHYGTV